MIHCGQFATHCHVAKVTLTLFGVIALSAALVLLSVSASAAFNPIWALDLASLNTKVLPPRISQMDSCESISVFAHFISPIFIRSEEKPSLLLMESITSVEVNPYETPDVPETDTFTFPLKSPSGCHRALPGGNSYTVVFPYQSKRGEAVSWTNFAPMKSKAMAAKTPMSNFMAGGF